LAVDQWGNLFVAMENGIWELELAPPRAPVPTLGIWGLGLLALLIAVAGFRALRRRTA